MKTIASIASTLALAVGLAGCRPAPGTDRHAGGNAALLTGSAPRPATSGALTLQLYYNSTASGTATGAESGRWQDLQQRAISFLKSAKSGSKLEVWRTGAAAGYPVSILERDLQPTRRQQRDAQVLSAQQVLERAGRELLAHPPQAGGSWVLEDVHRLAQRASALGNDSEIIVNTDGQEWWSGMRCSEIIRAGDDGQLVQRVLKRMPPPRTPPMQMTLVFSPGNAQQGVLSGADQDKLEAFFQASVLRHGDARAWRLPSRATSAMTSPAADPFGMRVR